MFLLIIFPHTLHIEQFGNGERFQLEYSLCPLVHTDEHDPYLFTYLLCFSTCDEGGCIIETGLNAILVEYQ